MRKKTYIAPDMEIEEFEAEDIITTSDETVNREVGNEWDDDGNTINKNDTTW